MLAYYLETARTPPHSQTNWLINDSKEIIKENLYIFFLSLLLIISFSILFYLFFFKTFDWCPEICWVDLAIKQ